MTCPEKPGSTKPAVAWVSRPSRPSDDLPSTRAAMSSGSETTSYVEPEHELARVQDERLVALGLDLAGQVGLVGRRVDVRVLVVLEDPEEPVQPHVDRATAAASSAPTGSTAIRPASISARMSRSESSTATTYPPAPRWGSIAPPRPAGLRM